MKFLLSFFLYASLFSSSYVVVTGGSGYIGSETCKQLSLAGYKTVIIDQYPPTAIAHYNPIHVKGDLLDRKLVEDTLNKYQPECVLHFAAFISVPESIVSPLNYYQNNFVGTLTLLEAMHKCNIKKLIFSSTAAVYGEVGDDPIDESHPTKPMNPYGRSKLFSEEMIKDCEKAYGIRSVIFRYFNAAGADLEQEVGQKLETSSHLMGNCFKAHLGQLKTLSIFGSDFLTKDGTGIRDYIHVMDLASAHVKAVDYLQKEDNSSVVLNLGTRHGYSVLEVIKEVEKATGHSLSTQFLPKRSGDPASVIADPSRAEKFLNWKASYSSLPTIVQSAWAYWNPQKGNKIDTDKMIKRE